MHNKFKSFISIFFAIFMLLSSLVVPTSAAESRASDLISNRSCSVSAVGNGKIAVVFSITTKGYVSRLGAQSMTFYAQNGSSWTWKASYDQYDAGMSTTNDFDYDSTVYYQGTSGVRYKVEVTLFATDSSGKTDTRDYTLYVNA